MRLLFFSLLSFAAVWCASLTQPVGIKNGGNFCYLSSVFQNLFPLPNFRAAVLNADGANDRIRLAIASVFTKLQTAPKIQYGRDEYLVSRDNAIDINLSFYQTYAASITREQKGLGLRPYVVDDPDLFLLWLSNVLPVFNDLVYAKLERTLTFGNVTYSRKITETVSSVQIPVLNDDSQVQDLQELLDSIGSLIEGANIDETDDEIINQRLTAAGVTFGRQYNVQEKFTISSAGSILPILVKRGNIHFNNSKAKLHYTRTIIINDEVYHLNGMVIGTPGHFRAVVRTNICNNDWHLFNDGTVTRLREEDKELSYQQEVALLFYVKKSEIGDNCSADEEYKADIPEAVLTNLGLSPKVARNDERDKPDEAKPVEKHSDNDIPKCTNVEAKTLTKNVLYDEPKPDLGEPDRPKELTSDVVPEWDVKYNERLDEGDESFESFKLPGSKLSEECYGGKATEFDAEIAKALNAEMAGLSNFRSSRVPTPQPYVPSWQSEFNDEDF